MSCSLVDYESYGTSGCALLCDPGRAGERLVVVAPAPNRAAHHPENLEDDADDDQDKAEDPQRRRVGEESNDKEEYTDTDHEVNDLPSHLR